MSDDGKKRNVNGACETVFDGDSAIVRTYIHPPRQAYEAYRSFEDCARYTLLSDAPLITRLGGEKNAMFRYSLFKRKVLKNALLPSDAIPFSFAKLLFTELLNDSEEHSPDDALKTMMSVLEKCCGMLSRAECEILFDFIGDYCLYSGIELPVCETTLKFSDCDFIKDTIMHRLYRALGDNDMEKAERLSLFAVSEVCGFDYKSGAAYRKNAEICEKSISRCACRYAADALKRGSDAVKPRRTALAKTLFCGIAARCELSVTAKIEYLSYTSLESFISELGEIAKYADNTLRRAFGIKSIISGIRLEPCGRTNVQREIAEEYPMLFNPKKRGRKPKPKPETSDKPTSAEPPRKAGICVNLERARVLEESSWDIAKRLGAEYGDDDMLLLGGFDNKVGGNVPNGSADISGTPEPEYVAESEWEHFAAALGAECAEVTVRLLENGDVKGFAAARGALADAYFAKINDTACDIIGDIVIDPSSARILDDYSEELLGVLPLLRKIASGGNQP